MDGQILLDQCLLCPADQTARLVFADWLKENDEPELEAAMRGQDGERAIRHAVSWADTYSRRACLRMLWWIAVVAIPHGQKLEEEMEKMKVPRGRMLTLPAWATVSRGDMVYRDGGLTSDDVFIGFATAETPDADNTHKE